MAATDTARVLVVDGTADILLLNLPRMSIPAVLARRATQSISMILLTRLAKESDRVLVLEIGADDYVTQPFFPAELRARVAAVQLRSPEHVTALATEDSPGGTRRPPAWWCTGPSASSRGVVRQ